MKNVLKILAFAVAFAAIGQSVYKARADQAQANALESLSPQERVEVLLTEKTAFDNAGEEFPSAKRRALSEALKSLLKETEDDRSASAIVDRPTI